MDGGEGEEPFPLVKTWFSRTLQRSGSSHFHVSCVQNSCSKLCSSGDGIDAPSSLTSKFSARTEKLGGNKTSLGKPFSVSFSVLPSFLPFFRVSTLEFLSSCFLVSPLGGVCKVEQKLKLHRSEGTAEFRSPSHSLHTVQVSDDITSLLNVISAFCSFLQR